MNKSQIRRLARDYSDGKMTRDDYLRRRRTLIDAIVDGALPIEREEPPPPPPPPSPALAVEEVQPPAPRLVSPLHAGIGVLVVALVAWALWPSDAPPPEPPAADSPPSATAPPPASVSPARGLVERFLAARDWGEASVESFRAAWSGLDPQQQDEALSAPWFRRFSKALRDEIKTQKALLELDTDGEAAATGSRLVALGEFLGLADSLPDFDPVGTEGAAPLAAPDAPGGATTAPPAPQGALSGSQWLASQDDDRYTLQLFALSRLDKVERLLSENAEMKVHIIDLESVEPRFRVLHGSFATEDEARAAHAGLPEPVRRTQPTAYAKRIGDLQAALGLGRHATAGEWMGQQASQRYTLQLFASDSRENADRLIETYPTLGLKMFAAGSGASRYRVLYGSFASQDEARRAGEALPRAILDGTGKPLVKSIGEIRAAAP